MCVHGHGRLVPDHRTHHIRGLATHSLQRLQVLDVIRHDTVIHFHQALRHCYQVFRFRTRITDRLYVFEHFITRGLRQVFRRGVGFKERRGHHVHPFVRTLRREHHRHQTLVRRSKNEFALSYRHVGLEPREDIFIAFSYQHSVFRFL